MTHISSTSIFRRVGRSTPRTGEEGARRFRNTAALPPPIVCDHSYVVRPDGRGGYVACEVVPFRMPRGHFIYALGVAAVALLLMMLDVR